MTSEHSISGFTDIGQRVELRLFRAPSPQRIEGRYVILEPLSLHHAPELFAALQGDDQVALQRYTADEPVDSEDELRQLLAAKLNLDSAAYFACIDRVSGQAAGFACFVRVDISNRTVEIGNVLFSHLMRRTRAATEAIYLMAGHAIEELGFRRLEWKCNDRNAASRHAALRFGFTFEGVFRQHMIIKGHNRDTAWYSLLDHEWPVRREALQAWLAAENFDSSGRQLLSLSQMNGVGGS